MVRSLSLKLFGWRESKKGKEKKKKKKKKKKRRILFSFLSLFLCLLNDVAAAAAAAAAVPWFVVTQIWLSRSSKLTDRASQSTDFMDAHTKAAQWSAHAWIDRSTNVNGFCLHARTHAWIYGSKLFCWAVNLCCSSLLFSFHITRPHLQMGRCKSLTQR